MVCWKCASVYTSNNYFSIICCNYANIYIWALKNLFNNQKKKECACKVL